MLDLVGPETQESMRSDRELSKPGLMMIIIDHSAVNLAKSHSDSSSSSARSAQTPSGHAGRSSVDISRNVSSVSLSAPAPNLGYKSYEHHLLRPADALAARDGLTTPPKKARKPHHPLSPVHFFRSHHHHIKSGNNARSSVDSGIHELPPEVVIEAVFNPHPATEEGPFTYVPVSKGQALEHEAAIVEMVLESAHAEAGKSLDAEDDRANGGVNGNDHKFGWAGRMKARKERKEREKHARVGA